jgi:hypothetical protein
MLKTFDLTVWVSDGAQTIECPQVIWTATFDLTVTKGRVYGTGNKASVVNP